VATIGDADPQVTAALRLVRWAGLKLATDDVVNLRLALMAILPNISGLVLAFGSALRRSRTSLDAPARATPQSVMRTAQKPYEQA
jgi:hypothetical protein